MTIFRTFSVTMLLAFAGWSCGEESSSNSEGQQGKGKRFADPRLWQQVVEELEHPRHLS